MGLVNFAKTGPVLSVRTKSGFYVFLLGGCHVGIVDRQKKKKEKREKKKKKRM